MTTETNQTAEGGPLQRRVSRARWHDADKEKPPIRGRHFDSDAVLCMSPNVSDPFVGWWNERDACWRVSHWKADNLPVRVVKWRELPRSAPVVFADD